MTPTGPGPARSANKELTRSRPYVRPRRDAALLLASGVGPDAGTPRRCRLRGVDALLPVHGSPQCCPDRPSTPTPRGAAAGAHRQGAVLREPRLVRDAAALPALPCRPRRDRGRRAGPARTRLVNGGPPVDVVVPLWSPVPGRAIRAAQRLLRSRQPETWRRPRKLPRSSTAIRARSGPNRPTEAFHVRTDLRS